VKKVQLTHDTSRELSLVFNCVLLSCVILLAFNAMEYYKVVGSRQDLCEFVY